MTFPRTGAKREGRRRNAGGDHEGKTPGRATRREEEGSTVSKDTDPEYGRD